MNPRITIVNQKHNLLKKPSILIDRSTWLGNPFIIGKDGDRDEVIERYKKHFHNKLHNNPEFRHRFFAMAQEYAHYEEIQLVCWCAPLSCHGEVIKEALKNYYDHQNQLPQ